MVDNTNLDASAEVTKPAIAKAKAKTEIKASTKTKTAPKTASAKAKAPKKAKSVSPTDGVIKITLVKSLIGRLEAHKACARGLGLSRIRQTIEVANTVENRGMINRISYLLKCEG